MLFKARFPSSSTLLARRYKLIHPTPLSSLSIPKATTATPAARYGDWRGTRSEDHSVNRSKKGDHTDPETEGTRAGQKEKEEGNGVADKTKSQATTERDQNRSTEKTEEEFPKAPRPIIGLTDERGEKGRG
ncbi:hypothetical protein PRK78_002268 [Emydomyces testavorans]|uniref:Uncharacterized protein n=1 Tax=Emydomyces testavorans TaxID=2070801 RepID=A0AAF0DEK3_9EURO|nr:hypothetical protein PRK78_002268 [Emydomyces testavorans]